MVDFSGLHFTEGTPIYLQIIAYIKHGLVGGSIARQDELPSRRVLSAQLGVNPNTIQKSYRLLEEAGLLASYAGAKSFLQADEATIATLRAEMLQHEFSAMVHKAKAMGITKQEALALLAEGWEEATP